MAIVATVTRIRCPVPPGPDAYAEQQKELRVELIRAMALRGMSAFRSPLQTLWRTERVAASTPWAKNAREGVRVESFRR